MAKQKQKRNSRQKIQPIELPASAQPVAVDPVLQYKPRKPRAPPPPIRTAESPPTKTTRSPAPATCPAESCQWTSISNDRQRALLRHIRYICTINKEGHKMQEVHQVFYNNMKKDRQSNPEKQKEAHKRYREKNKAKRVETARLHILKKEVRNSGESNEVEVERRARELMEERKRR
ncbi:hypothetical protein EV426DRAFT_607874 [Tirmania nivea]|nr:hypothetical protein EV426DRAFT_607874 [Tirmania nivea]